MAIRTTRAEAAAAIGSVSELQRRGGSPPEAEPYPVFPALRGLLPGGLRRGQVVAVDGARVLPVALVAGAVAAHDPEWESAGVVRQHADTWCGVVGLPAFGVLAAADMGAELSRILLIDEPGERWPDVVATLMSAVEVVLLQPPSRPEPGVVRRLMALARQHGTVLVVVRAWEGAQVRLHVTSSLWTGLGDGHGHLQGRRGTHRGGRAWRGRTTSIGLAVVTSRGRNCARSRSRSYPRFNGGAGPRAGHHFPGQRISRQSDDQRAGAVVPGLADGGGRGGRADAVGRGFKLRPTLAGHCCC